MKDNGIDMDSAAPNQHKKQPNPLRLKQNKQKWFRQKQNRQTHKLYKNER